MGDKEYSFLVLYIDEVLAVSVQLLEFVMSN